MIAMQGAPNLTADNGHFPIHHDPFLNGSPQDALPHAPGYIIPNAIPVGKHELFPEIFVFPACGD